MDRPSGSHLNLSHGSSPRSRRRSLMLWGTLIVVGMIIAFLAGRSTLSDSSSTSAGGLLYYLPFLLLMLPCLMMPFMWGTAITTARMIVGICLDGIVRFAVDGSG